jgi:GNAT superfamily N-acetyltransferase
VIQLKHYLHSEVPPLLAAQITSFQRIQWPSIHERGNQLWSVNDGNREFVHFVLSDDDMLISHASVNWRDVKFKEQTWSIWGVSSVYTYPAFRKGGFASRTVDAASDFIRAGTGDLAMLFCGHPLIKFYTDRGWTHTPDAKIFYGDPANPTAKTDNAIMMLFMSEKGRAAREAFSHQEIFVGPITW